MSVIRNLFAILVVVTIVVAVAYWANNHYDPVPADERPHAITNS